MIPTNLRFDGSFWVNMDITLRHLDHLIGRMIAPLRISVIEWYIMRALIEEDGQHASELARAVGRAATSFTPNLDKLQARGLIERRPDPSDRRAVRIHLTEQGKQLRPEINRMASEIEAYFRERFEPEELDAFLSVMAELQSFEMEDEAFS
ncbi:MAG: MarR family transcriptional regulator [Anaerolineae bacterium]|nr:MarR family transcriptional regulator [Anaerolineae bacterium]MCA9909153.1 MarR family transcriptional regulator [Anaerolineae bacterium]